ncbi:hypothetical protein ABPG72_015019 [Tetrahymena utriculariae]
MMNVYSLRSYLLENIVMHFNILVMKINPTLQPMPPTLYYDYINQLIQAQQNVSDTIQWIINTDYQDNRYSQSLYDSFFFSSFQNNLCNVFQNYPQYNVNSIIIDNTICQSTYQGILLQGVSVSYKKILTMFPQLYNMFILSNSTQSLSQINSFLSTFNLPDFITFSEFLDQTLVSLNTFILTINRQYYNYVILFQIVLIVFQTVIMLLVFTFGWITFSNELNSSLHKSKTYLRIIDINTLIQNTYILTYFKKNSII